jgi:hypothetical protein
MRGRNVAPIGDTGAIKAGHRRPMQMPQQLENNGHRSRPRDTRGVAVGS